MKSLLLTVGNIYMDYNVYRVDSEQVPFQLTTGTDYFAHSTERVLGGSAVNAALQAKQLGCDVAFIGKIGSDDNAQEVTLLLKSNGISTDLMTQDPALSTSMAINLIGKNGQAIGIHHGDASKQLLPKDIAVEHELFSAANGIYFGGTAKQPHLLQGAEELFSAIAAKNIPIFYDPNKFGVEGGQSARSMICAQLAHVTGYFPNEQELLQLTDETSVDTALKKILATGVGFVALKLGDQGCRVVTSETDVRLEVLPVSAITTVGAGDCFNATFISYYLQGMSLPACAKRANVAAAIKVSQNLWPTEDQILQLLPK